MNALYFTDRRVDIEPAETKLVHAIPPETDSPLHTIGLLGMREGEVIRWLENHQITTGYLHTVDGVQVFSYYECDKYGESHGSV